MDRRPADSAEVGEAADRCRLAGDLLAVRQLRTAGFLNDANRSSIARIATSRCRRNLPDRETHRSPASNRKYNNIKPEVCALETFS